MKAIHRFASVAVFALMLSGCDNKVDRGSTPEAVFTINLRELQGFVQTTIVEHQRESLSKDLFEQTVANEVNRCLKEYWHDPALKTLVVNVSTNAWLLSLPTADSRLPKKEVLVVVEIRKDKTTKCLALLNSGAVTTWNTPLTQITNDPLMRVLFQRRF